MDLQHLLGATPQGRWLALRPVNADDYPYLEQLVSNGPAAQRWRLRGRPTRPEHLRETLWQGALAQYTAVRRRDHQPCGLALIHDADLPNQTAWIGAVIDPGRAGAYARGEVFYLLLEQAFGHWDLRKAYALVPEYNVEQFGHAIEKYARLEARLHDHDYHLGRYWDCHIIAFWRHDIEPHLTRYRRRVQRSETFASSRTA